MPWDKNDYGAALLLILIFVISLIIAFYMTGAAKNYTVFPFR